MYKAQRTPVAKPRPLTHCLYFARRLVCCFCSLLLHIVGGCCFVFSPRWPIPTCICIAPIRLFTRTNEIRKSATDRLKNLASTPAGWTHYPRHRDPHRRPHHSIPPSAYQATTFTHSCSKQAPVAERASSRTITTTFTALLDSLNDLPARTPAFLPNPIGIYVRVHSIGIEPIRRTCGTLNSRYVHSELMAAGGILLAAAVVWAMLIICRDCPQHGHRQLRHLPPTLRCPSIHVSVLWAVSECETILPSNTPHNIDASPGTRVNTRRNESQPPDSQTCHFNQLQLWKHLLRW